MTRKRIDHQRAAPRLGYAALAELLRQELASGSPAAGGTLPPVRALGLRHGVSHETVRRAIAVLDRQGLVRSEGRRGHRVSPGAGPTGLDLPVAFVLTGEKSAERIERFSLQQIHSLQQAAAESRSSLLVIGGRGRSPDDILQQARASRAGALVLDAPVTPMLTTIRAAGLPVLVMGDWQPGMDADAVVQDSYQGAALATQHLLERGHRRLGWLGHISQGTISRDRFGGFAATAAGAGCLPPAELMADTPWEEVAAGARRMLDRPDRPTGVCGLWYAAVQELVLAARSLQLVVGKDIDIVGWTEESEYEQSYRWLFPDGRIPATIVWSGLELARLVFSRLRERRANPGLPPALIKLPVRIRQAGANPASAAGRSTRGSGKRAGITA